ncbi:putative holin [Castellaniella caeni]|uniref:putative holin n=1 Tax=Castellaniella caeni TaxID=266123 RepID=UPI000C9EE0EA|nr:putative holin [Castellaniella caeni]
MSIEYCDPAIPVHRRLPRLSTFILLAAALIGLIAAISPVQLPVVVYKLSLISLAAVVAYWLDRALFPYARPDGYLERDWRCGNCADTSLVDYPIVSEYRRAFVGACLRRAVIVAGVVIGVALGL